MIGCDGGRSQVRKSMDVEFEGFTYDERFLILSTPYDFGALGYAFTNYIADPTPGARCSRCRAPTARHVAGGLAGRPDARPRRICSTRTPCRRACRTSTAMEGDYDVVHRNVYNVHQRVASCYRDGRMLLAGDAAHINNPLGGMGMNFGIHDAFNLTDKLAPVGSTARPTDLLDLYDRQRRTVAQQYLQTPDHREQEEHRAEGPGRARGVPGGPARHRRRPRELRAYLRRVAMIEGYAAPAYDRSPDTHPRARRTHR